MQESALCVNCGSSIHTAHIKVLTVQMKAAVPCAPTASTDAKPAGCGDAGDWPAADLEEAEPELEGDPPAMVPAAPAAASVGCAIKCYCERRSGLARSRRLPRLKMQRFIVRGIGSPAPYPPNPPSTDPLRSAPLSPLCLRIPAPPAIIKTLPR